MVDKRQKLKNDRLGNGLGDHLGLSWTCVYAKVVGEQEVVIDEADRQILRDLALRVAERAADPLQTIKRKRWTRHNDLQETQPLLFCDPELAWYELIPSTTLRCQGNLARLWEFRLRKELYWADNIRDDRVITNEWTVQYVYETTTRGCETEIIGGGGGGAYRWDPPVKDYQMVDSLSFKQIRIDEEKTLALFDLAQSVFDGLLTVRLEGSYWWTLGLTSDLILLRGFEQVMLDMYDDPEGLHKLMAFLRDEKMAQLDFLEQNQLLSLNNRGDFVGTGGYGWTSDLPQPGFDGSTVRLKDLWGFAESQETVNVSPDFFKEYVFGYQKTLLERFGLTIYGCCEPLDLRWDAIQTLPRLRRVTVSPWSNPSVMAEKLGNRYVYCRKINPAYLAVTPIDEDNARRELRETFTAARAHGCPTEVMLRDVLTFDWHAGYPARWVQMAREEAGHVYGSDLE